MNVAAGTWRQGGPIGGGKEAEQTRADRQTRRAELIEGLILNGCSDFGMQGELGSDPVGWTIDALHFLPKKLHEALRSPAQAVEERETGRVKLHELADAVPGVGYRDVAHRYVDNLKGRRLDRFIAQATAARNGATIREAAPGLEQTINIAAGLSMIAAGLVGPGTVQRLAEGDQQGLDHQPPRGPEWKLPVKVAAALGFFSQVLTACREFLQGQNPQPPTVEVTQVTVTPEPSKTPSPTLTTTPSATATETSTLVPTETPVLPLLAFISGETIGDGTVLFPIMRAPLPPELSTFIPVDGKLVSGGGELTGLSGVKLCLGVESDATCYGVRAPAPEFLSRHLEGRVVTYQLDRNASKDGVQIYTTNETGEGIAPQQVFINRVPMRPGLHFETVIRDGSDQNDPGAGQLLMMWIDANKQKVVDELAQVRDFNPQTDRIDIDYTNGVITLTYADGRVEPFHIGQPRYPTAVPSPEPKLTVVPTIVPRLTEVRPMEPTTTPLVLPTATPIIIETPTPAVGEGFTIPHGSVPPLEDLGRCMQGGVRFEERDNQYLLSGVITSADASGINFAMGVRLNASDITAGVHLVMYRNGNSLDSAWVDLPYSLNEILALLTPGQFVSFSKDGGFLSVRCYSR